MLRRNVGLALFLPLFLILIAGFSPPPAIAQELNDGDRERLTNALEAIKRHNWSTVRRIVKTMDNDVAADVVRWFWYTDRKAKPDFPDVSRFIADHPGWPRQRWLRMQAELNMPLSMEAPEVLSWFEGHEPITGAGNLHYIDALMKSGRTSEAVDHLRRIWRNGQLFTPHEEKQFYARYRKHLTKDDHIERMDALLWGGRYYDSRRMFQRVGQDHALLGRARLMLRRQFGNVDRAIQKIPKTLKKDPGLIFERVRWRTLKRKYGTAMELLLAEEDASRMHPEKWWRYRHILARKELREGSAMKAYRLASRHHLTEGVAFAEAEWLSGWIALRYLDNPARAAEHFKHLHENVGYPVSVGRAAYWTARALDADGKKEQAQAWYAKAAGHPTTYYGQLALAKTGRPVALAKEPESTEEQRKRFQQDPLLRAIDVLVEAGRHDLIDHFVMTVAKREQSPGWLKLASNLGPRYGRPDLGVKVAKLAAQNHIYLYRAGYPTISLPGDHGVENAFVHAIIRQESQFFGKARSRVGARGLMQVMPRTARKVSKQLRLRYSRRKLLTDETYNLKVGQAYLSQMLERFNDSYIVSLAAYNAGPNRARRWIRELGDPADPAVDVIDWVESIPYSETRNYVQRVMESLHVYRVVFGDKAATPSLASRP